MRMRTIQTVIAVLALGGTLFVGFRGAGPLPPLGGLLDPVRGAWGAVANVELEESLDASIPALREAVDVRYDVRGVPHIFAKNEEDLMRALGFVVARDRLFQLELQWRAGGGRLTELVGARAIPADSEFRHLGLTRSAELRFAALNDSSESKRLMVAYAEGVNAYVDALPPAKWPVEYKLLGAAPARYEPINAMHLMNRMGWTLAYSPDEWSRIGVQALIGKVATDALFPVVAPIQEPIQPSGATAPRFSFAKLPPPGATLSVGDSTQAADHAQQGAADPEVSALFASNNWVVSPGRSQSKHALLAGDPHLQLTLPSIWYEVHLVIPGQLDVYGVTIPGGPGVLIGFNRDIAWSATNTGADVQDYYREVVDQQDRPTKYLLDSAWREIELREEAYRDQQGRIIRLDTVRFTHRGPLLHRDGEWVSMRWTVLEAKDASLAFFRGAQAKSAREFLDVMADGYTAPAQNLVVADRAGNIGLRSTGHFPIRPPGTTGLAIFDGSTSASDWRGMWPVEKYPQGFNPAQGFLASANQQPIDPAQDSTYLGQDQHYESWRALQINRLLRADSSVTLQEMQRFQTEPTSVRADLFVPTFIADGRRIEASRKAAELLAQWDRRYTTDNSGAILFETALTEVARRTWDELIPPNGKQRLATPSTNVLLELMADSQNVWWDDRSTSAVHESRGDIISAALAAAYDTLTARWGDPAKGGWRWGKVATARVGHLLGLRGFSAAGISVQGGRGTLNPSVGGGGFGSSWRMVVELGQRVRAMGTYPGGQSGNPASSRYTDRLRYWANGELELLLAPAAPESLSKEQVRATLSLRSKGAKP